MIFLKGLISARKNRGFSLVELLISMVIFTIVMGIIYTYLLQTKTELTRTERELEAAENAQRALNALRDDLYLIGVGIDTDNEQPKILFASPYDFIFCADLDRTLPDKFARFGAYDNDLEEAGVPEPSKFLAVRDLLDKAAAFPGNWSRWDNDVVYGSAQLGAEVVRYSLDYNSDGDIDSFDEEDYITGEYEDLPHNQNPVDFYLNKEWWGMINDPSSASGFRNSHSGIHPVAFNIHGNVQERDAGSNPGLDSLGEYLYPRASGTGEFPPVLFTYWGHFFDTETDHNNPGDEDWEGEPLDLWGDWGDSNSGPPGVLWTITPGAEEGNGALSSSEVETLLRGNSGANIHVHLDYIPSAGQAEADPADDTYHDYNGNGIEGENRLDQFIRRIGITIVTEAGSPDPDRPNTARSDFSDPANPKPYLFRDYEVSIEINPKNLVYKGSPQIRVTPVTPSPIPSSTPVGPPTPTPAFGTTYTPIPEDTPVGPPTETPTVNPTFAYNRDEILIGSYRTICAVGIPGDESTGPNICDRAVFKPYWIPIFGDELPLVVDMEAVDFCSVNPSYPDEWNDVVYATDSNRTFNLFYMNHLPHYGIDGFRNKDYFRVGNEFDRITAIAVGNIGSFGPGFSRRPEVVVAYVSPAGHSSLSIVYLDEPCGGFFESSCVPFVIPDTEVVDLVLDDFDGDGVDELVVLTNAQALTGPPQLLYFNDLGNCNAGWNLQFQEPELFPFPEIPAQVDSGFILSPEGTNPDLIVVSRTGNLRVIPNSVAGVFLPPYNPAVTALPPFNAVDFQSVTGFDVYKSANSALLHPQIAVLGRNVAYNHLASYGFPDSPTEYNMEYQANCSGSIYPTPLPTETPLAIFPLAMEYFEFERIGPNLPVLAIGAIPDISTRELILIMDPCGGALMDICRIDLSETGLIFGNITCITSTRKVQ